jgi:penicillin-binding protein-related factor A (putative recombinase)
MNEGKQFERDIISSAGSDVYFKRINDPAQSFGDTPGLRFSPKNGYDFMAYQYPHFFALELKSTKSTSIDFQRKGDKRQAMIKWSQIEALLEAGSHKGIISGLILNWRDNPKTMFVHVNDFFSFMNSTTKKSINRSDINSMPHVLLEQKLLKVHFRYNIQKFISDCVAQFS